MFSSVNKLKWDCHLAEKANFGAVVEDGRLLNSAVGRLQLPQMRKRGEQLVELSMPHNLHAAQYRQRAAISVNK